MVTWFLARLQRGSPLAVATVGDTTSFRSGLPEEGACAMKMVPCIAGQLTTIFNGFRSKKLSASLLPFEILNSWGAASEGPGVPEVNALAVQGNNAILDLLYCQYILSEIADANAPPSNALLV